MANGQVRQPWQRLAKLGEKGREGWRGGLPSCEVNENEETALLSFNGASVQDVQVHRPAHSA